MDTARKNKENSDFIIRTEFSFLACDHTLASILEDIADESVNIAGYVTNRMITNENFVRLVPGSADSESKRDVRSVRKILQAPKIEFKEQKVLTISPDIIQTGVPGGYSRLYNSLRCCVNVKSFYLGEDDFVYLNVSNLKKALEILSK